MKKDIEFPVVKGISIAIVRNVIEHKAVEWYAYIINQNLYAVTGVIINSRGYGHMNGEKRETSTLRQLFDEIPALTYQQVESLDPTLFSLYNEFWVSYYANGTIYDKRFTFVPDSIVEENLIMIPALNMQGVLHE